MDKDSAISLILRLVQQYKIMDLTQNILSMPGLSVYSTLGGLFLASRFKAT